MHVARSWGCPAARFAAPWIPWTHVASDVVRGVDFNVHAALALDGHDRRRVEQRWRYLDRPSIAQGRLTELSDGRLRYEMKKAWRDGVMRSERVARAVAPATAQTTPR